MYVWGTSFISFVINGNPPCRALNCKISLYTLRTVKLELGEGVGEFFLKCHEMYPRIVS